MVKRILLGLVAFSVVAVVAVLLLLPPVTPSERSAGETLKLFSGIPQKGQLLGDDGAVVKVAVFTDPQCPACNRFDQQNLPRVIRQFVRNGKVQLRLVPVALKGSQSRLGGQAAYAAGQQNKMWQFYSILLSEQKAENSGYITPRLLRVTSSMAGANAGDVLAAMPYGMKKFQVGSEEARRVGVDATPTFLVSGGGLAARKVVPESRDAKDLDRAILDRLE